jgi:mRNA-degrading endonuclease HigB of HigAB toxin-antitoxin module
VDGFVVFNFRHNRYRLIVAVHYAKSIEGRLTLGHVYIGSFMAHSEYGRWSKATEKKRAEWLHF